MTDGVCNLNSENHVTRMKFPLKILSYLSGDAAISQEQNNKLTMDGYNGLTEGNDRGNSK